MAKAVKVYRDDRYVKSLSNGSVVESYRQAPGFTAQDVIVTVVYDDGTVEGYHFSPGDPALATINSTVNGRSPEEVADKLGAARKRDGITNTPGHDRSEGPDQRAVDIKEIKDKAETRRKEDERATETQRQEDERVDKLGDPEQDANGNWFQRGYNKKGQPIPGAIYPATPPPRTSAGPAGGTRVRTPAEEAETEANTQLIRARIDQLITAGIPKDVAEIAATLSTTDLRGLQVKELAVKLADLATQGLTGFENYTAVTRRLRERGFIDEDTEELLNATALYRVSGQKDVDDARRAYEKDANQLVQQQRSEARGGAQDILSEDRARREYELGRAKDITDLYKSGSKQVFDQSTQATLDPSGNLNRAAYEESMRNLGALTGHLYGQPFQPSQEAQQARGFLSSLYQNPPQYQPLTKPNLPTRRSSVPIPPPGDPERLSDNPAAIGAAMGDTDPWEPEEVQEFEEELQETPEEDQMELLLQHTFRRKRKAYERVAY